MTQAEIKMLMGAIAPVVREYVEQQLAPIKAEVAELRARPEIVDRGVWAAGANYARGSAVSFSGSLWIAQRDTPGKPGESESGWRLAVKRGRDGKDAPEARSETLQRGGA